MREMIAKLRRMNIKEAIAKLREVAVSKFLQVMQGATTGRQKASKFLRRKVVENKDAVAAAVSVAVVVAIMGLLAVFGHFAPEITAYVELVAVAVLLALTLYQFFIRPRIQRIE